VTTPPSPASEKTPYTYNVNGQLTAKAFAEGHPIGDGAGPLVASKLMRNSEVRKVEKDMVAGETVIEGRRIIAMKAEGPGGNVGATRVAELGGEVILIGYQF
jgi:hypothetical protein